MTADLSKPHFTVVLDEHVGDTAVLQEADNGELFCFMHPSAAEDSSPARSNGHAVFRKAVETVMQAYKDSATRHAH